MLGRQDVIAVLETALFHHSWARAAWLGGSDANGRTDRWSDIDLVLVVTDGHVEVAIDAIDSILAQIGSVTRRYRLPDPTWHGHAQVFLQLHELPEWTMVDTVVINERTDRVGWFLEPERHGTPKVLFDKDVLSAPVCLNRSKHRARINGRLRDLHTRFQMFQHLTRKAIRRGDIAEAVSFYNAMTIRPLVEFLRIVHCPERFDFGLRYLQADLPPEVAQDVADLCLVGSLQDIEHQLDRAGSLFNESFARFEAQRECLDGLD